MSRLIPELDVVDLDRSLAFYVGVIGFNGVFDRLEERDPALPESVPP
jgi:catechol 2,3-dioxygenase-like lactoylglutathione lyase family enzyme